MGAEVWDMAFISRSPMIRQRLESRHSYLSGNLPGIEGSKIIRLWGLRVITRLNGWSAIQGEEKLLLRQQVEQALNIDSSSEGVPSIVEQSALKLDQLEAENPGIPDELLLIQNLRLLAETISLSETEVHLFFLAVVAKNVTWLGDLLDALGELRPAGLYRILTTCLDITENEVQRILSSSTPLGRSGLIQLTNGPDRFTSKLAMPLGVMDALLTKLESPIELLGTNIQRAESPKLDGDSFPHLKKDIDILSGFLSSVVQTKEKGANVLVYGPPGTGKTEFVKMLAKETGLSLLEIGASDGVVAPGADRLRFFEMAQAVMAKSSLTAFLFDEVEDVFGAPLSDDEKPNRSGYKARFARLLEENPIPSFWVTNHIRSIDPAFRRRFDYVLEIKVPPRSVRKGILDRYLEDLPIGEGMRELLADNEKMPPAVIERVARVIRRISDKSEQIGQSEKMLTRVLDNTLSCLGLRKNSGSSLETACGYDFKFINTDFNPSELIVGLQRSGKARICLYGPPGTGKTAFAIAIANSLDRTLVIKRASDILSPWVGVAEENIAHMFEQANDENAVLLLDEADSFLQDRQGAVRSWEITQVNEMLTQMEAHEGIFIASTNLFETLDPASLRRFDLKAKFDYLTAEQADTMFEQVSKVLGLDNHSRMPCSLSNITPGDFAAVVRQARFRPIASTFELYRRIKDECEMKPGGKRQAIGFAA